MGEQKKVMALADWPGILNAALVILRKQVDANGYGVFSMVDVFKDTEYRKQVPTISRYLQTLGILTRGKKTAAGPYAWHLVMDRKVTVADVRKVRTASAVKLPKTTKKPKATKVEVVETKPAAKPQTKPKATKPKAESTAKQLEVIGTKLPDLPLWDSLPLLAEVAKAEFDALQAENAALKARLDEVEAFVQSFGSTARS
jgi:hypothetical protein